MASRWCTSWGCDALSLSKPWAVLESIFAAARSKIRIPPLPTCVSSSQLLAPPAICSLPEKRHLLTQTEAWAFQVLHSESMTDPNLKPHRKERKGKRKGSQVLYCTVSAVPGRCSTCQATPDVFKMRPVSYSRCNKTDGDHEQRSYRGPPKQPETPCVRSVVLHMHSSGSHTSLFFKHRLIIG